MTGASGHHAARLTFQSASVLNEYFALPAWACGPLRGAHVDWFCMPSRVLSVLTKCEPWALSVSLSGMPPLAAPTRSLQLRLVSQAGASLPRSGARPPARPPGAGAL
jgi:hypothetical protein